MLLIRYLNLSFFTEIDPHKFSMSLGISLKKSIIIFFKKKETKEKEKKEKKNWGGG
jgi:hypothetical protein